MNAELNERIAQQLASPQAVEIAYECATAGPIAGLLDAIAKGDEAEVGRLLCAAVRLVMQDTAQEAIDNEQDRAQALDEAEHSGDEYTALLGKLRFTLVEPCSITGDGS